MNTSYFAKYKGENAVSIAGKCPEWFKGRQYKKLAPRYWFFKKYKEDGDKEFYTEQYYKEVLDKLDPKQVYEEIGEDAVVECWEGKDKNGKNKFCHRHIFAKWIYDNLGIEVKEL